MRVEEDREVSKKQVPLENKKIKKRKRILYPKGFDPLNPGINFNKILMIKYIKVLNLILKDGFQSMREKNLNKNLRKLV